MRSEVETRRRRTRAGAGVVLALMTLLTAITTTAAEGPQPTREQVASAVEKLKADPNLGVDQKTRKLVRNSRPEPNAPQTSPGWLNWIADAFRWLASTARALLWVAGILLAGILGLYIKRFVESRGERSVPLRFSMPTHVRDLDIRPESLPDDVGGAALELWERGEHRAALALLYRGLLSRLAHLHAVPIRDSSTEGDCLALAATHLPRCGAIVGFHGAETFGCQDAAYQLGIGARVVDYQNGWIFGHLIPSRGRRAAPRY